MHLSIQIYSFLGFCRVLLGGGTSDSLAAFILSLRSPRCNESSFLFSPASRFPMFIPVANCYPTLESLLSANCSLIKSLFLHFSVAQCLLPDDFSAQVLRSPSRVGCAVNIVGMNTSTACTGNVPIHDTFLIQCIAHS